MRGTEGELPKLDRLRAGDMGGRVLLEPEAEERQKQDVTDLSAVGLKRV